MTDFHWDDIRLSIQKKNKKDVENALTRSGFLSIEDFKALLSPAAQPYLETMAGISHSLTIKRFGRTIQLYAPVYVSNYCTNFCTYCGFSCKNSPERKVLNRCEFLNECGYLHSQKITHILLVSGESNIHASALYFKDLIAAIRSRFHNICIEVQPLSAPEYEELIQCGLDAVYIYQETYNKKQYGSYHPKGPKSDYEYRLRTPERACGAGITRAGLGVLLGLEDWAADIACMGMHLRALQKKYWKTRFSFSFPRLRPAEGMLPPKVTVSNRDLAQIICACRLFDEDIDLVLSTRESAGLRNKLIPLGITAISAGSKTSPGGYTGETGTLEQFRIDDERSPESVSKYLGSIGYETVWKDWAEELHPGPGTEARFSK